MMMVRPLGRTLVVIFCSKLLRSCAPARFRIETADSNAREIRNTQQKLFIHAPYGVRGRLVLYLPSYCPGLMASNGVRHVSRFDAGSDEREWQPVRMLQSLVSERMRKWILRLVLLL